MDEFEVGDYILWIEADERLKGQIAVIIPNIFNWETTYKIVKNKREPEVVGQKFRLYSQIDKIVKMNNKKLLDILYGKV